MVIISSADLLREFQNLMSNMIIHIFVLIVLFDIATGLVKGVFFKKEGDSTKGLLGLVKHLLVVVLVITAVPYLNLAGFSTIADWFVGFYIAVYAISIFENFGQMGVPFPTEAKDFFIKLKEKPVTKIEEHDDSSQK